MSLPSGKIRSKTGCLTCKQRRKKCDETRPVCQRCTKLGMHCLGYSYLDNPNRNTGRGGSRAAARVARTSAGTGSPDSSEPGSSLLHVTASVVPASTVDTLSSASVQSSTLLPPNYCPEQESRSTADEQLQELFFGFTPGDPPNNSNIFDFSFLPPAQSKSSLNPQPGGQLDTRLLLGGLGDLTSLRDTAGPSNLAFGTSVDQSLFGSSATLPDDWQSPMIPDVGSELMADRSEAMIDDAGPGDFVQCSIESGSACERALFSYSGFVELEPHNPS